MNEIYIYKSAESVILSVCPRIGSYTVYVKAEMTPYNDRRGIKDVQWVGLSKGVQGQRSCGGKKHVEPPRNDLREPNLVRRSSDRSLIHSRGQRSKVGSNFNLLRSGSNLGKVILHMGRVRKTYREGGHSRSKVGSNFNLL